MFGGHLTSHVPHMSKKGFLISVDGGQKEWPSRHGGDASFVFPYMHRTVEIWHVGVTNVKFKYLFFRISAK